MTISAVEYMNMINDLYNVYTNMEEDAEVFTRSLFKYFMNGCKNIYPASKKKEWVTQVINNVLHYDGDELSDEERKFRVNLAEYVGHAYFDYYGDQTYCAWVIAFIIRHDLHKVVDFIRHQAEKLSVSHILYQKHSRTNEVYRSTMTYQESYLYTTKSGVVVSMFVYGGTTFKDEDIESYPEDDMEWNISHDLPHPIANWHAEYFPNLDLVRVRNMRTGEILKQFPDELLA